MEKGYRLKYKDYWVNVFRAYGEITWSAYENEHNINIDFNYSYEVAKHLKGFFTNTKYENDIKIVEYGELKENIAVRDVLLRRSEMLKKGLRKKMHEEKPIKIN